MISINLLKVTRTNITITKEQMNSLILLRGLIRSNLGLKELTYSNNTFIIKSNIIKIGVK